MMKHCIFCSIIRGEIRTHRVYEDEKVLAFLDIHPSAPGHTLIIPKKHYNQVEDLSEDDAKALFMALYRIVGAIQEAMEASSSTIGINNGPEAGQEVPHLHIHVIPRRSRTKGSIVQRIVGDGTHVGKRDFMEIAERIRTRFRRVSNWMGYG
jgi:histidine triad (HIT) family protein